MRFAAGLRWRNPSRFNPVSSRAWEIESSIEYDEWWGELTPAQQRAVDHRIEELAEKGINLGFPHSSGVQSSRHSHMRELRVQSGGRPLRVFYAFDPLRTAILLIGGDKTGNNRFYRQYVPVADRIYDRHLDNLRQRGLIP